jgi:hypothetical protein
MARRVKFRARQGAREAQARTAGAVADMERVDRRRFYRAIPRECPECGEVSLRVTDFTALGTPVMRCECRHEQLLDCEPSP